MDTVVFMLARQTHCQLSSLDPERFCFISVLEEQLLPGAKKKALIAGVCEERPAVDMEIIILF